MKLSNMFVAVALAALISLANTTADAQPPVRRVAGAMSKQAVAPAPLRWRSTAYPATWVSRLQFRDLPLERISEIHSKNARRGVKPTQIGIARSTTSEGMNKALPALRWISQKNGGSVARIEVRSPDALALRVGLRLDALDKGVELRFAGSDQPSRVVAEVKGEEAKRLADTQRIYWTPGTDGDTQIIELYAPAGVAVSSIRLHVPQLSHLVSNSRNSFSLIKSIGDSGSCNVDTACRIPALGQHFINAKNAVAHMLFVVSGGSFICTGTLLNDTVTATSIPYFYSAHHCISDGTVANTLNTYWGLEATSCNSGVSGPTTQLAGGAAYLYSSDGNAGGTDALLLRLNNPAPAGAYFAGWDAAILPASSNIVAIHHPVGDLKKSSLGQQISSSASEIEVGWTSGTTEGGSSGSGLFTGNGNGYFLRGGLRGGSASCANSGSLNNPDNRDYYSRLDVAYPNIRQYLAPPAGGNPAPVANFNVTTNGLIANFTDTSTDSNGSIVSRSWNFGDGTTSTAANPSKTYSAAGTYSVRLTVTDNGGASNSTTRSVAVTGGSTPALSNGVPINGLAGTVGAQLRYTMSVPAGASNLTFITSGGTGDVDLYVKFGSAPTTAVYDCRSFATTNNETCTFPTPQTGIYHILLHAFASFSGVSLRGSYIVPPSGSAADRSDFNGDGRSDILWRNGANGANLIWLSANANTRQTMSTVGDPQWKIVGTGDFGGDGKADILWRNGNTGANVIWRSGSAVNPQAVTGVTNLAWKVVGVGDFNGDGLADILWRNAATGANTIWRSASSSSLQAVSSVPDLNWKVAGVGDVDGDLRSDIVWRNSGTGANSIWRSGNSTSYQPMTGVTNLTWQIVGLGDFDVDGRDDVVWRNNSTGANVIWRSANAATGQPMAGVSNLAWRIVGSGDYNGDGRADVLWRNFSTGTNTIWKSANSATQQPVVSVADLSWVIFR